jgi:uncharacterized protein YxjI
MSSKLLSFFVILLSTISCYLSALVEVPSEFFIKQRWLSWTTAFDVETRSQKIGSVHRRFLSLTVEYDFYDYHEVLQANARMRIFSFGAIFDVTDPTGNYLGTINERIFTFFPTFDILSADGEILTTAKMNFWGTKYDLRDPVTDRVFAKLYRPFIRFKDDWTVQVTDRSLLSHKGVDPRLFIIVAAFQTDMDFWRAQLNNTETKGKCISFSNETILSLKERLAAYPSSFKDVEPTEKDVANVDQFIEEYLSNQNSTIDSEENRILKGIDLLIPLLDGDELTVSQKSALFLMMDGALTALAQ